MAPSRMRSIRWSKDSLATVSWGMEVSQKGKKSRPGARGRTGAGPSRRHRIVVRVEHPAGFLRKIEPWWAKDVDELVDALAYAAGGVDRRRRDHGHGGRGAVGVLVLAPGVHVHRPRPAQMMDERALHRQ